jgi:hypothetical protein
MYKYLIDKLNNSSYFQIIYEIKRMKFFHERNANLLAFNCLNNVYSEDKIILMINYEYYVYHLFNAYNFKKQITPVEYTYKLVNKKCKINTKNFNYEDIILHGLPMDDEEWVQFLKMYDIYQNNHDIFYVKEEIDNRLKKVKK